jgi:hypothetical protein
MQIPAGPDDLSTNWVRTCLLEAGVDAQSLLSVTSERIGTGLVGENYRLTLTWDGPVPDDAPTTLVAKLPASDPTSRATGIALRNYEREVRFYAEVASTVPTRLARCFGASWDEGDGSFVIVLEDLAPGEVGDQLRGCTVEQAETAIDVAAAIHSSHWGSPQLETYSTWMSVPADDERAALLEMMWTAAWPQFLERHPDKLGADERSLAEHLGGGLRGWLTGRSAPLTLTHGDFRIDNMLFGRGDGATSGGSWMVPVDWQTPGVGPGMADVSYFLGASLLPEDRRAHEQRIVRRWVESLTGRGVSGLVEDDCWNDYRRFSFGGAIMGVVASMLTQQTERGDAMFFAMTSRHLRQALDLDAAEFLS